MATTKSRPIRKAFTLVEMLVVMTIIILLAGMAYMFLPSLGQRKMASAADRISAWLLIAKQQAKRDGRPTGVRLIDTNNPNNPTSFTQMAYVQQPDDITFQGCTATCPQDSHRTPTPTPPLPNPTLAKFGGNPNYPGISDTQVVAIFNATAGTANSAVLGSASTAGQATVDFEAPVEPGDYIEFMGIGSVYQITAVVLGTDPSLRVAGISKNDPNRAFLVLSNAPPATFTSAPPATTSGASNYRILRQPRKLLGEEDLTFPDGTAIWATYVPDPTLANPPQPATLWGGTKNGTTSLLPRKVVKTNSTVSTPFYEIMFSPDGNVISQGAGNDKLYLWLYDTTLTGNDVLPPNQNLWQFTPVPVTGQPPLIISIQIRTGLIGTFPVDPTPNPNTGYPLHPYAFANLGRSSGM